MGLLDFLGLGSARRSALQAFDRALVAGKVNPAYVDDGMRYALYKWAKEDQADGTGALAPIDQRLTAAAALMSYCVIGPTDTEAELGLNVRIACQRRFEAVLAGGDEDSLDARVVKLTLAKGIAAPEITALVDLTQDESA